MCIFPPNALNISLVKVLHGAALLLRNSRVTDTMQGELEFVPWPWPFWLWWNRVRMTTVLKKVLQDHVVFHSFQMTKVAIISQVLCRGKGRCVVWESGIIGGGQASAEHESSIVAWVWVGTGMPRWTAPTEPVLEWQLRWLPGSSYALSSFSVVFTQGFLVCLLLHVRLLALKHQNSSHKLQKELEHKDTYCKKNWNIKTWRVNSESMLQVWW